MRPARWCELAFRLGAYEIIIESADEITSTRKASRRKGKYSREFEHCVLSVELTPFGRRDGGIVFM